MVKQTLLRRGAFAIVLLVGIFAMAARNVVDPDFWWHMKTGEWMALHHAISHTDPFSYSRAGMPWTDHEWLFEVALYGLYCFMGYGGLIVTFGAIISFAFLPLYLRCRTTPAAAAALTTLGALATSIVWGVRPQILTLFLLSLWLLLLERSENNPRLLLWTLPLTVLWVNLHGGFIIGPVFLGLFLAGEILEELFERPSVAHRRWLWYLAFALVGDLAVFPLNPNGASILLFPLRTANVQGYITEWASPDFHSIDYLAFLLLFLITVAVLAFAQRRVKPRDLILLLAGTTAALSSVRMIPLFVLIAVPLASRPLGEWLPAQASTANSSSGSVFINAGVVLALLVFAIAHTSMVIHRQPQAEAAHFPKEAVAYLREHPPAGRLFNHYDWGGYLIFQLYPQIPVLVDGRTELYGEALMEDFLHAYYLQGAWKQAFTKWDSSTVIVPPDSALASALREESDWSVSYEDSLAVIFTKAVSASNVIR